MFKIKKHPILEITPRSEVSFYYENHLIKGQAGLTIASALHQAGFPVHSHSLKNRNRSLECGIGKCGACEMLVDGQVKRICITKVDGIKQVKEIPKAFTPKAEEISFSHQEATEVFRTKVAIVGAGPAGLAARAELLKNGVDNVLIDNNDKIGGQFPMQTHPFFFFEKEKRFGGKRGFEIADALAGENHANIFLTSTVWDILEGKRIAIKNIKTEKIFFVESEFLIVATGAVPFMPPFENDDLPGVYTAAVIQKMMNNQLTLLGKNILTVGAGNIGYLTSYQLMQAGAKVKAIIEAQDHEGGFPVQANRVRRLGIPVLTSHILLQAIPNKNKSGITGAVIAKCKNFHPIRGTEKIFNEIDAINICTGLVPDNSLLIKGNEIYGRKCFGAGDAVRIGEGTTAVMRGKQAAYEIIDAMHQKYNYNEYLRISKEYIDSQQHPIRILEKPAMPGLNRQNEKPFVIIDCLYGFACNPCAFSCPHGAISKTSTSTVPRINYSKCTGCMKCIHQCPGLAIFGYDTLRERIFIPLEYEVNADDDVFLVDNYATILGTGKIEKIKNNTNKTRVARIKVIELDKGQLTDIKGFIEKQKYPTPLVFEPEKQPIDSESYICHCDDVKLDEILKVIGKRKFISVDEIKHTTRLGMGACRGKRCIGRLKQILRGYHISLVGEATPRGPLSNPVAVGELYPTKKGEKIIPVIINGKIKKHKVQSLVAGGGIGGSSLFRYLAEARQAPVMINYGHGSSWRNIAGGRPVFSVPELSDIAKHNLDEFTKLQNIQNIDFNLIKYISFAHDETTYQALEESMKWQNAEMIQANEFKNTVSPYFNPSLDKYIAALVTKDCWQATPGKVIDLIRKIGVEHGGKVEEDARIINIEKQNNSYYALVQLHDESFIEYETPHFINALGAKGHEFAKKAGYETGLYPVKHQAFITRRLPMLGINNQALDMIIDRRKYKGFSAVYGQQLGETGQIIGCASPMVEPRETGQNLKINSKDFMEIVAETFIDWIPRLANVGWQAVWAGYYIEPRMIIDTEKGLFLGLRGQGFMLGQYLAKLYVQELLGKSVPAYFNRLRAEGDGLLEKAFK